MVIEAPERIEAQTIPLAEKCESHCGGRCKSPIMQRALNEGNSTGSIDAQAEIASFIEKSPEGDYLCVKSGFNDKPSRYHPENWYEEMWQAQSGCPGYRSEQQPVDALP